MDRKIVLTAAVAGMIAIILGAFGAHGLKNSLDAEQLTTFETGVRYQMYHALLLLFVGLSAEVSRKAKNRIYYLILFGMLFFSGSIYLLATRTLTGINIHSIGWITPVGGFLFIVGWFCLFIDFLNKKS